MKKLYALSMAGTMYYLLGTLSSQECNALTCFSEQFKLHPSENESETCERFLSEIKQTLNIDLRQISISQVFRIGSR